MVYSLTCCISSPFLAWPAWKQGQPLEFFALRCLRFASHWDPAAPLDRAGWRQSAAWGGVLRRASHLTTSGFIEIFFPKPPPDITFWPAHLTPCGGAANLIGRPALFSGDNLAVWQKVRTLDSSWVGLIGCLVNTLTTKRFVRSVSTSNQVN